jgi:hypothetical protein
VLAFRCACCLHVCEWCECGTGKVVGCLPAGGIKKHTPGLGASLRISFRTSLHAQPGARPSGAPLRCAACHGFSPPLVAAVRPCIQSCPSPSSLPALHCVTYAALIRASRKLTITHSFATTLHFVSGSLSRARPCLQGLLIAHGRHPAGPLRLRLRFWRAANTRRWLPASIRHHRRQSAKSLALRSTDRCLRLPIVRLPAPARSGLWRRVARLC